jgi:hypothetical protein
VSKKVLKREPVRWKIDFSVTARTKVSAIDIINVVHRAISENFKKTDAKLVGFDSEYDYDW